MVGSEGRMPASGRQPLPGIPVSTPYWMTTDSAWAQAGSVSLPSVVMGAPAVERAQM